MVDETKQEAAARLAGYARGGLCFGDCCMRESEREVLAEALELLAATKDKH